MNLWQKIHQCVLVLTLIAFGACGKTKGPFGEEFLINYRPEPDGLYRAPLLPLNAVLKSRVKGRASFFIKGIQFYTKVKLDTRWSEVAQLQSLHAGQECPTISDDVNGDGFVDAYEVIRTSGKIILPLDGDLRSQMKKIREQPSSDETGAYFYSEAVSLILMMKDLHDYKTKRSSFLTGLGLKEHLTIMKRVIIIYGIPRSFSLPSTVQGIPGFSVHMTVPLACSKIYESQDEFP